MVEYFKNMRKSNCKLCDGWGVVTVVINNNEYGKACDCKAGEEQKLLKYKPFSDKLKFPENIELTEEENLIYEKFKHSVKEDDLCPF